MGWKKREATDVKTPIAVIEIVVYPNNPILSLFFFNKVMTSYHFEESVTGSSVT